MKNKIIAFIISAALLLASLTLGVFADGETLRSGIFKINSPQDNTTFEMADFELKEVSKEYINKMFDTFAYDASLYGAYKASLFIDDNEVPFSSNIDVTINIGEEYSETEVFVFHINEDTGVAYDKVDCVRNGADFTISGEDFAAMSDDIIVVMTGVTAPEYTIVPAVICAAVALIAIITSVLLVKKKSRRDTITD